MTARKAVCLLSGGLDSSTCLGVARRSGFESYALSFDYGQRHRIELVEADRVCARIVLRPSDRGRLGDPRDVLSKPRARRMQRKLGDHRADG